MPWPPRWPVLFLLLPACFALCASAGAQYRPKPDVIFVPTDNAVADAMLRMAKVSKDSVVYDLGCGDGRIVITAAKRYGARGVGIDIDPDRIDESRENARAAGVQRRVRFVQADLFQTDFHEATAVMLYLLSSINVRLRPILMRQLRPGTPIVSHDFMMGDWLPDETDSVNGAAIFLWIVPAKVAGVWRWTSADGPQPQRYELTLRQHFQKLDAALLVDEKEEPVSDLKLVGDRLAFATARYQFAAQLADGVLNGLRYEGQQSSAWTASRVEGTGQEAME